MRVPTYVSICKKEEDEVFLFFAIFLLLMTFFLSPCIAYLQGRADEKEKQKKGMPISHSLYERRT